MFVIFYNLTPALVWTTTQLSFQLRGIVSPFFSKMSILKEPTYYIDNGVASWADHLDLLFFACALLRELIYISDQDLKQKVVSTCSCFLPRQFSVIAQYCNKAHENLCLRTICRCTKTLRKTRIAAEIILIFIIENVLAIDLASKSLPKDKPTSNFAVFWFCHWKL